jgi:CRISPR/Cas system-associated protein Cas10 (large subunit of type III CRISPR-Cas system)|tara:strand:- start:1838 stop:2269 length:432 start_codon:yes stop_codon:yes gene_type:complete
MDLDEQLELAHLLLQERKCRVCGQEKNLIDGYYRTRKNVRLASSYSYECKECTVKRVCENNRRNRLKKNRIKKMKQTENLQQLMERFTKRLNQTNPDDKERVSYLKGCIDTVDYLATGKLPNDGNHDGMKNHRPRHSQLDALD